MSTDKKKLTVLLNFSNTELLSSAFFNLFVMSPLAASLFTMFLHQLKKKKKKKKRKKEKVRDYVQNI